MTSSPSKANLLWLLFTIVSSALFGAYLDPPVPHTKKDWLRALETRAKSPRRPTLGEDGNNNRKKKKKITVGLNACLDGIVLDAHEFMRTIPGVEEGAENASLSSDIVRTLPDLLNTFSNYFSTSSAAERSVENATLWEELLQRASSYGMKTSLGGNAALMAEALMTTPHLLATPFEITLIGMIGPQIANKLSASAESHKREGDGSELKMVSPLGSAGGSKTAASEERRLEGEKFTIREDEIHLILEYPPNAKFGNFKSQRANRFILSRDLSNGAMAALEALSDSVYYSPPALLILAGVHMMDGMRSMDEFRRRRMERIKSTLRSISRATTKIHLEMASVGDEKLQTQMVESLLCSSDSRVDSIGLNEQEFATLANVLGITDPRNSTLSEDEVGKLTSAVPPVAAVQKASVEIFAKCPALSRVHFHSFSYHMIILRRESTADWTFADAAVAAGSVAATERACAGKVAELHGNQLNLNVNSLRTAEGETLESTPANVTLKFEYKELAFHFAPVLTCVSPKQTVGLGDYISAVALGVHFA